MNDEIIICGCSYTKYLWPTWADFLCYNNEARKNIGYWAMGCEYVFHEVFPLLKPESPTHFIVSWPEYDKFEGKRNGEWFPYGRVNYFPLRNDYEHLNHVYDDSLCFQKSKNYILALSELMRFFKIKHSLLSVDDRITKDIPLNFIEKSISRLHTTDKKKWKKGLYNQANQIDNHLSCHDNFILAKKIGNLLGVSFSYSETTLEKIALKIDGDLKEVDDIEVLIKKPIEIKDYDNT